LPARPATSEPTSGASTAASSRFCEIVADMVLEPLYFSP
jgi:hypothetical protein